ncbi:Mlp family lipoprotein (plasmid) [Borrelia coriaceae]|uniref:Mlp lipoprotein family protein n=1 Tax=Borrelia coriaceae ATCC 43381 TaxID=1408429 RepID=W5SVU3_9SPIR|nr:Mlp family lipoprotein [Borrelia coriaceae]AHH11314.1 Mlp lipoprotein family protein [Borrelia coriaceae ATCC 43381]UPA17365.1 Mlp family lipoprotein [Borrelia coriaceae]
MKIIIKLLVLYSTTLFYCCNENESDIGFRHGKKHHGQTTETSIFKPPTPEITAPTNNEKTKSNSFINGLNIAINEIPKEIKNWPDNGKEIFTKFIIWLSKDIQKQKELEQAFSTAYNFLETKRQQYANNETFDQYIQNGIITKSYDYQNGKYGIHTDDVPQYSKGKLIGGISAGINFIRAFFSDILETITTEKNIDTNDNDKIFASIITTIQESTNDMIEEWKEEKVSK